MRKPADKDTAVAVLISDCHFSVEKPKARAGSREDWLETQGRHLSEVMRFADEMGVPVVIAGDVFDTWDQPTELVTAVAGILSYFDCPVYMIPGQHDLPYHEMAQVERSALFNLVYAARGVRGKDNVYLLNGIAALGKSWFIYGAGWGQPFDYGFAVKWREAVAETTGKEKILLCAHKYIHVGSETSHPGAKKEDCAMENKFCLRLDGYAACLFGDNHIPFTNRRHANGDEYVIYNHGAFIRRKSDERKFDPEMGVLYDDGFIERLPLKAALSDLWYDGEDEYTAPDKQPDATMTEFAESVKALAVDETVDFRAACNRLLGQSKLSTAAKREILELLDDQ